MRKILFVALFVLLPTSVLAQTVINPRFVEFTPSADHDVVLSDGAPKVQRYEVRWYAGGASAPLTTTDLAKPVPASGKIRVDLSTVIGAIPIGQNYSARVAAIGPSGEGVSDPSNPFERVSPPLAATNVTLTR